MVTRPEAAWGETAVLAERVLASAGVDVDARARAALTVSLASAMAATDGLERGDLTCVPVLGASGAPVAVLAVLTLDPVGRTDGRAVT